MFKILDNVAKSGDSSPYPWIPLRNFLLIVTKDVLTAMHQQFPDIKNI